MCVCVCVHASVMENIALSENGLNLEAFSFTERGVGYQQGVVEL